MKFGILISTLIVPALGGCDKVSSNFNIEDPHGTVRSAELRLCRSHTELNNSNRKFNVTKMIDCEGEGYIFVHLSDGRQISCHIGYVTFDIEQNFDFVVDGTQCLPKD